MAAAKIDAAPTPRGDGALSQSRRQRLLGGVLENEARALHLEESHPRFEICGKTRRPKREGARLVSTPDESAWLTTRGSWLPFKVSSEILSGPSW
jgi:hypothetical protein